MSPLAKPRKMRHICRDVINSLNQSESEGEGEGEGEGETRTQHSDRVRADGQAEGRQSGGREAGEAPR